MTNPTTPAQFHAEPDVDDWRVIAGEPSAYFRTASFAEGLAFLNSVADTIPDTALSVDLRPAGVYVRLPAFDAGLARAVSAAARELGLAADPTAPHHVQVALDALVRADLMPFWAALLGYEEGGPEDLVDPFGITPPFWFQGMDEARTERGRFHIDVSVPHDLAEARVAAAVAAGGRLVTDAYAPSWWVLADAEGNEACVCTWMGRE